MTLDQLLAPLTEPHRKALLWFVEMSRHKELIQWPEGPDNLLVATKAKGIYKPKWSSYALSIRQSLGDDYNDVGPTQSNGSSWTLLYHCEGTNPYLGFTNEALLKCMEDKIPVGVIKQRFAKPNSLYEIVGLGLVKEIREKYFYIESILID